MGETVYNKDSLEALTVIMSRNANDRGRFVVVKIRLTTEGEMGV
jgi:hypothetical protein